MTAQTTTPPYRDPTPRICTATRHRDSGTRLHSWTAVPPPRPSGDRCCRREKDEPGSGAGTKLGIQAHTLCRRGLSWGGWGLGRGRSGRPAEQRRDAPLRQEGTAASSGRDGVHGPSARRTTRQERGNGFPGGVGGRRYVRVWLRRSRTTDIHGWTFHGVCPFVSVQHRLGIIWAMKSIETNSFRHPL